MIEKCKIYISAVLFIILIQSLSAQHITDNSIIKSEDNSAVSETENYKNCPHYNLDLTVNPQNGSIEGTVSIEFLWSEHMFSEDNSIYISLLLNSREEQNPYTFPFIDQGGPDGFSPSSAEICNVYVNSNQSEWSYAELAQPFQIKYNTEHLICKIKPASVPVLNELIHIEFEYKARLSHSKDKDEFYFENKMISRFLWFPYILNEKQVSEARFIFPNFTYKAAINSAVPGWEIAAPGMNINYDSMIFESTKPVTSLPLIFLKNHNVLEYTYSEDQTIRVYYENNDESTASLALKYSADILRYFSDTFFPVDYKYINIIQGNPGIWSRSCDSAVIIGDGLFGALDRGVPDIFSPLLHYHLARSIANFYFGISTDLSREKYIVQGLCEYAGLRAHELKYGIWKNVMNSSFDMGLFFINQLSKKTIHSSTVRGMNYYSVMQNQLAGWDSGLVMEPEDKNISASDSLDHDRAYFVIHMLFNYCGNSNIDEALKFYLDNSRYMQIDSETFKNIFETFYNKDLDLFFDTFIFDECDIDYCLTGTLNEEKGNIYVSTLNLQDLNNNRIFIPVRLTIFYKDGSQEERLIESTGEIIIESSKEIDYTGIDKDLTILDYNRRNNFFPKQTYFISTNQYWLSTYGASKWYFFPYLDSDNDYIFLGYGPRYYSPFKFLLKSAPFLGIPKTYEGLESLDFVFAAGLKGTLSLPRANSFSFITRYIYPDRFSVTEFGYTKIFHVETDLGYTGHTYNQAIKLGTSTGLADFFPNEPDSSETYLFNKLSLEFDFFNRCGTQSTIKNQVNYFYSEKSVENRISALIRQGIPFIPRTLLSVSLKGTISMGEINNLGASNSVLGFASEADDNALYSVKLRSFFGIPVFNSIEVSMLNWIVLQSINFGIVYEGVCAFSGREEIREGIQQAIGFEIIPCFRTVTDLKLPVSIGISFNLTDIFNEPYNGQSYIPRLYLELTPEQKLFSSTAAF